MQRGYLDQYGEGEDRRNSIIVRAMSLVLITAVISSLFLVPFEKPPSGGSRKVLSLRGPGR